MIARTQRIGFRIEQHHHALALVIMHQEEPENRDECGDQNHRDTNQTPAEARQEKNKQAGERDEDRGAKVRLRRHQQRWQENQYQRDGGIFQRWGTDITVDKACHHQWNGDFGNFRGLEANHAQIQPALCTFGDSTKRIYRNQQNNTEDIEIGRPAFIDARRDLRHHHHDDQPHRDLANLALHHADVLAAGAPDNQGAVDQQSQQDQQHGWVDVDFIPQRFFIWIIRHDYWSSAAAAAGFSAGSSVLLSPSMMWSRIWRMMVPTAGPAPPFSRIIATATCGLS